MIVKSMSPPGFNISKMFFIARLFLQNLCYFRQFELVILTRQHPRPNLNNRRKKCGQNVDETRREWSLTICPSGDS